MKKIAVLLFVAFCGFSVGVEAQTSKKAANGAKQGARAASHKTAQASAKAKITDETVSDYRGPNGEKIYVDDLAQYYYIDKKGQKEYIDDSQLVKQKADN